MLEVAAAAVEVAAAAAAVPGEAAAVAAVAAVVCKPHNGRPRIGGMGLTSP